MTIEKKALAQLWQEAFGDTPAFINGFFQVGFSPARCEILERDGRVAAALYWFDCLCGSEKVACIYGVATQRAYRGQGLCRLLMANTRLRLQRQGYAGAVLVPGDAGLYRMYEKLGYRGFCPMEKVAVAAGGQPVQLQPVTPEGYDRAARLPEGSVRHTLPALEFYRTYGQFYIFDGGAFCAAREGDTLYVQEFFGDPASLPGIGAALGAKEVRARLPGGGENFAMYLSFQDGFRPEYFAMALD